VAQRIKAGARYACMRLVVRTGYGKETDRVRSRKAGFDAHIVQPMDLERPAAALR
jgi:CheY-like chemotaxis protein